MQHHKYSLTEIENMMPWERDIYVDMLITYLKEEKEKQKMSDIENSKTGWKIKNTLICLRGVQT